MTTKSLKILFVGRSTNQWPYHSTLLTCLANAGVKLDVIYSPRWSKKGEIHIDSKKLDNINSNINIIFGDLFSEKKLNFLYSFREFISACSFLYENNQPRFYFTRWLEFSGSFKYLPFWFLWLISNKITLHFLSIIQKFWSLQNLNSLNFKIDLTSYDCVIVQHQTMRFSIDNDIVLKAQQSRVPVVGINYSWDCLYNKGLIHVEPDRFYCWNASQKTHLIKRHNFQEKNIIVSGSVFLDRWDLSNQKNNKIERRFIVIYGGSSSNIVNDETMNILAVKEVINELNNELSLNLKFIFRPHPSTNIFYSSKGELDDIISASRIAGDGINSDYFDKNMFETLCVVGVNTSLFLDCIANKIPIISAVLPEAQEIGVCNRRQTSHFKQLNDYNLIKLSDDKEQLKADIIEIINHRENWLTKYSYEANSFGITGNASQKIKDDLFEFLSNN